MDPKAWSLFVRPSPVTREARVLSSQEEEEVRIAFDLFCGEEVTCDYRDLKAILRALGFPVKKAHVLRMLDLHNKGIASTVDFKAFTAILRDLYIGRDAAEVRRRAFCLFDTESKGKISPADLRVIATELGLNIGAAEIQAMIQEFDQDGDGVISETEFLNVMSLQDM